MSTLGGNRGERDKNAKPKFQQLDINSLYRSSRGETSEPTTQKNAVPRKHGMQSLGKVPSARRPPANLPSLKAETSSPASSTTQSSDQQQQQTTNSSSASWADSGAPAGAQALSNTTSSANQTSQLNTSGGSGSASQTHTGGNSAASSSSTSWSAVATGGNAKEENSSQPPLYQSPQFQNEFPSLDGSVTTNASANVAGLKQNANSNSHDSGEMNLRPSTDAASWMQQQQSNSGNARGGGGENGSGNYPPPDVVPAKFMALMPAFMMRGTQSAGMTNSPAPFTQNQSNQSRDNRDIGRDGGGYQSQGRQQGRNSSQYGGSYNNDYSNNRDNGPPRHRQPPPRHSDRGRHNDDRGSSYEPEMIVQRPIIKEEELERIDSLARDEGWSKHDEIDYNKKIQFSDDEPDDVKPKDNDRKDAWRDGDKKQNGGRIDLAMAERIRLRQEEHDRQDRERKMAAQKKLQELEEKSKSKSTLLGDKEKSLDDKSSGYGGDFDKKSEQRGSMDYGKKYGSDKYDSYDGYGRGAPANDFKKSSYQSNLPPRFQKQQHIERHDDRDRRNEKPGPPGYGKPLHQQDSKNIPFAQQSYEQRWMYNKQSQQAPPNRRNMSSLSQSSSDDNRRDNGKGYGRRRLESEEDDYRYGKDPSGTGNKKTSIQAQITRSMSDSSDKLSDHNRSDKSTSREYLGQNACWAEACENDKRPVDQKSRRVSESSAMSDDQPRTILQRNKPLHEQLHGKDVKKEKDSTEGEKKSVLSETPPKTELGDEKKALDKSADMTQGSIEQKKSLESIPEKDQNPLEKTDVTKDSKMSKDSDKKSSPRSNRYERDARSGPATRGNYPSYRGSNWPRRGGHQRGGGRYEYSDSENSDEYEPEWNRNGPKSMGRKDLSRDGRREGSNYSTGGPKEGFSPRGEPSRRGRGGVATTQSTGFRRSGSNGAITAPAKNRIDNYGPPSSKSPFGSNDEKSSSEKRDNVKEKSSDDDRTKQKQKALSDGLMNKSQKESTNVATQKASSPATTAKPEEGTKQHSTEPQVGEPKDKKSVDGGDDKASNDGKSVIGQRTASASSFNSNQSRSKNDRATPTSTAAPGAKPGQTKAPQSNAIASGGKPATSPASNQYPSSMQKPMDPRHQMNRNDPRMDPRNANSRTAPRFANKQPGQGQPGNMNRMGGNYWDKNHPSDHMHGVNDDKMSMMQMNPSSGQPQGGINASQANNNLLNSKTDVMKQNQQQPSMQQQQQQNQNQAMLDGASLKTTLIFENTSYKSGPPAGLKRPPPPMGQQKPPENTINTINDMIDQQAKEQSISSALQNLSFGQKTQNDLDMNFSYSIDSQIGLFADDRNKSGFGAVSGSNTNVHPSQAVSKSSSLGLVGAKTGMQNSNILNTDALNLKVASCKKVWEEPSSMEHGSGGTDDVMSNYVQQQHLHQYGHNNMNAHHTGLSPGPQAYGYGSNSANDHNNSLEHFNKSNDGDDGSSYPSPGQQQHMGSNMVHSQNQQANMNMKPEVFGGTANVCKVKPTQQQMHQAGLSPPPQMQQSQLQQQQQQQQPYYSTPNFPNMSTIPSPPAVVYNSQNPTGALYNPYNLDAARAQLYGYQTGGTVGANNSMSFNAFMQTPNLTSAPTHEMYQNLSQYRTSVQPFNQTPQLNNPNAAVLISSATGSNSMMSSKSNSQIGAIGSKSSQSAGGPAAASGQYTGQYMNHLYHPHQNSYYTNSTAQQPSPYYGGPTTGGATTGNYGMFASHGTNVSNGPPPQPQQMANFGSVGQFPLGSQMVNNLLINQQYRNPVVNAGNNGNSNASGSNSNAPPGGYSMKQQHQSQLQDSKFSSSSITDANTSHKMYNNQNWESSSAPTGNYNTGRMYSNNQSSGGNIQSQNPRWPTPGPIQRPSNNTSNGFSAPSPTSQFVNYPQNYPSAHYQQRPMRNSINPSMANSPGMSMMSQSKSQYFNQPQGGSKLKSDGDKTKPQAPSSPTKAPGDSKAD